MKFIFMLSVFLIIYTYFGYGITIWILVKIKRMFTATKIYERADLPNVTVLVAAYNEADCIEQKIQNTLALNYPKDKLQMVVVTDGTTDHSAEILAKYPEVQCYHKNERMGKMAAINRVMPFINSDLTVFTDANAMVNTDALMLMASHFTHPKVGVVAGEKRILNQNATTTENGEGLYWKYESALKVLDSELGSAMGAAGELYAIRTSLFVHLPLDTLLDDFMQSLLIAKKGYKIVYEKKAHATETASINMAEELKRKIRISAGGLQSSIRLAALYNPFQYGFLSFQLLCHRIFRWTVAPIALVTAFISNAFLVNEPVFMALFVLQILFYAMAVLGFILEKLNQNIKALYLPFYFSFMHFSVFLGFWRMVKNQQSVNWDKAQRL